jgi:mannose-6-phosphate isomerase
MPTMMKETRPWGHFERFTLNEKCTVKLIYVDKDKRLSLQYHNNRSEYWKIVKGPVKVEIGRTKDSLETKLLQTGESITIAAKTIHRLIGSGGNNSSDSNSSNNGDNSAIILEISTGEFDESDIIRLEDDYKRE